LLREFDAVKGGSLMDDTPESFGYKMAWLAIRSADTAAVANALPLADMRKATWQEGIETVYEHYTTDEVFVTPAIEDWTLVVGLWAWGEGSRPEQLIANLSKQFGEVQSFATHRVTEYHHWLLARKGVLVRSYAYVGAEGRVIVDYGEPTEAELELGYKKEPTDEEYDLVVASHPDEADEFWDDFWWRPDEEIVMELAGEWSVNPSSLDEDTPTSGTGILAKTTEPPMLGNIAP
jgi:hypothetical protein